MDQQISFYRYNPSLAAAGLFAALYGIGLLLTTFLWLKHRAWVCAVLVIAAASMYTNPICLFLHVKPNRTDFSLLVETIGYIGRCVSTQNVYNQPIYVLQFSLTVLAPVLIAAFCYIVFGRITFYVVPKKSRTIKLIWVPPRFVTPIFVVCDIIALLLQLSGAVMIASTQTTDADAQTRLNHGKGIAQAGVIIQLLAFGLFTVVAIRFNFTSRAFTPSAPEQFDDNNNGTIQTESQPPNEHWPALLRVVNIVSGLILVGFTQFKLRSIK